MQHFDELTVAHRIIEYCRGLLWSFDEPVKILPIRGIVRNGIHKSAIRDVSELQINPL